MTEWKNETSKTHTKIQTLYCKNDTSHSLMVLINIDLKISSVWILGCLHSLASSRLLNW